MDKWCCPAERSVKKENTSMCCSGGHEQWSLSLNSEVFFLIITVHVFESLLIFHTFWRIRNTITFDLFYTLNTWWFTLSFFILHKLAFYYILGTNSLARHSVSFRDYAEIVSSTHFTANAEEETVRRKQWVLLPESKSELCKCLLAALQYGLLSCS